MSLEASIYLVRHGQPAEQGGLGLVGRGQMNRACQTLRLEGAGSKSHVLTPTLEIVHRSADMIAQNLGAILIESKVPDIWPEPPATLDSYLHDLVRDAGFNVSIIRNLIVVGRGELIVAAQGFSLNETPYGHVSWYLPGNWHPPTPA